MPRTSLLLSLLTVVGGAAFAQDPVVVDPKHYAVLLDNARVRVLRFSPGPDEGTARHSHPDAVLVPLPDAAGAGAVEPVWMPEAAHEGEGTGAEAILVELKGKPAVTPARSPAKAPEASSAAGAQVGEPPLPGISFTRVFENPRVSASRARMEANAGEKWHTHGNDIVVVHLSGGEIEDTADGEIRVNRWRRGDVEFEAKGSSHSARNLGAAIEVVLVMLK